MPIFFYYFTFYAIILLVGDSVNLEIMVNDYLLAWYILYGASLSKEIDKFKRNLFTKYKKEYNFCYKDRGEILKYGKDFIPDNDILYNAVLTSNLFKSLKKETIRLLTALKILLVTKEQQKENPKFAMRTWLLRLGFIGEEFATAREILTRRLDGDTAFRHGRTTAA